MQATQILPPPPHFFGMTSRSVSLQNPVQLTPKHLMACTIHNHYVARGKSSRMLQGPQRCACLQVPAPSLGPTTAWSEPEPHLHRTSSADWGDHLQWCVDGESSEPFCLHFLLANILDLWVWAMSYVSTLWQVSCSLSISKLRWVTVLASETNLILGTFATRMHLHLHTTQSIAMVL